METLVVCKIIFRLIDIWLQAHFNFLNWGFSLKYLNVSHYATWKGDCRSLFQKEVLSFINCPSGLLSYIHTRRPTNPRSFPTNFYGLVGYDRVKNDPRWLKSVSIPDKPRCIRAVSLMHPRSNPAHPDLPPSFRLTDSRSVRPTPDLFLIQPRSLRSI